MATDFQTFKTALASGGARPSLFDISITPPVGVTAGDVASLKTAPQFKCFTSEIPGLTVTPIERQYFGRTVKIPGDITFAGTFSTTFINTEDFDIHTSLNKWMEYLNPDDNGVYASGGPQAATTGWAGTVTLTQYRKSDAEMAIKYIYEDCWPSNISAIELSYDSASTIEEFSVTWEYNYFQVDKDGVDKDDNPVLEID